ncbi:hypothetical protein TanjilG_07804 [Lupinus angustifolius]|uniref:Uncharacterized protein n=1 Tax=Lupinus angustifolius TaxID=3871 RepID=A0A1J7HSE7_LUPAN|nr:hypothetical protein TanjilG_07804 [Lupinus angustifolius]
MHATSMKIVITVMVLVVAIIITLMGSAEGIRNAKGIGDLTGIPPPDCCLIPFCCDARNLSDITKP